jgi:hypothetical protein
VHFLSHSEARILERRLRRRIKAQPKPRRVLYYQSGNRDYPNAARLIAPSIGVFTEAIILFQFAVTGDGWNDYLQNHEGWRTYREWRKAAGDAFRLYDAPGHRFDTQESERLAQVIEFALVLGWDALIAATPGQQLAFLSHDDRMEIYRGFESGPLTEKLVALGYWRDGGARACDIVAARTEVAKSGGRRAQ